MSITIRGKSNFDFDEEKKNTSQVFSHHEEVFIDASSINNTRIIIGPNPNSSRQQRQSALKSAKKVQFEGMIAC